MEQANTRPGRFRPILTMILVTIVLVLSWLGLEVYFAVTAKPNPTIDYGKLAEDQVRAYQADFPGEDVWPVMLEAIQLFGDTTAVLQDEETEIVWGTGNYSFDAVFDYDAARADLKEQEADSAYFRPETYDELDAHRRMAIASLETWDEKGLTRRLDEIAASGKSVRPLPDTRETMMIDILLPELGTFRNLAKALRARMVVARDAGDWALYAKSFEHGLAIGRHEMSQVTIIDRLVGVAIRALMFAQLRDDLVARAVPDDACAMLQDALDRQGKTAPLAHSFDAELNMHLDAVQWTHDRRGRVILSKVHQLDYSSGPGPSIINVASIAFPRRAQTEQWFRDFNEKTKADAVKPVAERVRDARNGISTEYYTPSWNTVVQDMLVPAYGSVIRTEDQIQLQELGARVLLAIERYRHATGKLPESLESLTPQWLAEPATDPYSIEGNLLGYRVFSEPDEQGRMFVLYSIGYDGKDNQGAAPTENMPDALRNGYPDTDYVMTEPIR